MMDKQQLKEKKERKLLVEAGTDIVGSLIFSTRLKREKKA